MKKVSKLLVLAFFAAWMIPFYGCKKDAENPPVTAPAIATAAISMITATSAEAGGNVISSGGAEVISRGVCWSTGHNPTVTDNKTTDGHGSGTFTSSLTGLTAGTNYYVRAYAVNNVGTAYGDEISFTASAVTLATLTTTAASAITGTTATSGGEITSAGGGTIIACGVCWSTGHNPTIADNKTTNGYGSGTFTSFIAGLTANTIYYVRAYATNSAGTAYGPEISFKSNTIVGGLATLTTANVTSITYFSAESNINVIDDGGSNIVEKGICYGTAPNPTKNDSWDPYFDGQIKFYMGYLRPSTKYYVRAYATNSTGTAYGNELNFTTLPVGPIIFNPDLTFGSVSDIEGNIYKTIQIGTQLWMAENLRTTRFNDGTPIPNVTDFSEWLNLSTPGYCWLNDDALSYKDIYGALYNWNAVSTSKLCPSGWHVPNDSEFSTLISYLGSNSGNKVAETGNTHWLSPAIGATNESGFTGLPGGILRLFENGVGFAGIGLFGDWWSATDKGGVFGGALTLYWDNYIFLTQSQQDKIMGFSVRCLKDN